MKEPPTAETSETPYSPVLYAGLNLTPAACRQIIFALQLFLLLSALDQTVISTAMPRIIEQLGGFNRYSWATTGYLFSSTIAVPVAGKLSDLYGRKTSLIWSVALFVLASLACGSAASWPGAWLDGMNQLILFRILQGIGGGAVVSLCFTVVGDLYAPAERGKYQGYFAAVFALASIAGPALGGWVADVASWRWLFYINLPIAILGIAFFSWSFKDSKPNKAEDPLDWRGLILFCLASTNLLLAVSLPTSHSNTFFPGYFNILCLVLFCIFFTIFIRIERQAKSPFLPIGLFRRRIILISVISLAVYGIGMFGASLLVPLFMQSVRGMSGSFSGIVLSPLILTVAISSIVSGQWMSRTGKYKTIVLVGLSLMTVGVFALAALPLNVSLIALLSTMLVVSLGIGLLLPIYTVVIQNAVEDELIGTVTGLSQFFRSIGGTLGVACLGSLLISLYHGHLAQALDSHLPPSMVSAMDNPLTPKKLRIALKQNSTNAGDDQFVEKTVEQAGIALYKAIQLIYLFYGATLALTVLLNLLLEEFPLRSTKMATSPKEL